MGMNQNYSKGITALTVTALLTNSVMVDVKAFTDSNVYSVSAPSDLKLKIEKSPSGEFTISNLNDEGNVTLPGYESLTIKALETSSNGLKVVVGSIIKDGTPSGFVASLDSEDCLDEFYLIKDCNSINSVSFKSDVSISVSGEGVSNLVLDIPGVLEGYNECISESVNSVPYKILASSDRYYLVSPSGNYNKILHEFKSDNNLMYKFNKNRFYVVSESGKNLNLISIGLDGSNVKADLEDLCGQSNVKFDYLNFTDSGLNVRLIANDGTDDVSYDLNLDESLNVIKVSVKEPEPNEEEEVITGTEDEESLSFIVGQFVYNVYNKGNGFSFVEKCDPSGKVLSSKDYSTDDYKVNIAMIKSYKDDSIAIAYNRTYDNRKTRGVICVSNGSKDLEVVLPYSFDPSGNDSSITDFEFINDRYMNVEGSKIGTKKINIPGTADDLTWVSSTYVGSKCYEINRYGDLPNSYCIVYRSDLLNEVLYTFTSEVTPSLASNGNSIYCVINDGTKDLGLCYDVSTGKSEFFSLFADGNPNANMQRELKFIGDRFYCFSFPSDEADRNIYVSEYDASSFKYLRTYVVERLENDSNKSISTVFKYGESELHFYNGSGTAYRYEITLSSDKSLFTEQHRYNVSKIEDGSYKISQYLLRDNSLVSEVELNYFDSLELNCVKDSNDSVYFGGSIPSDVNKGVLLVMDSSLKLKTKHLITDGSEEDNSVTSIDSIKGNSVTVSGPKLSSYVIDVSTPSVNYEVVLEVTSEDCKYVLKKDVDSDEYSLFKVVDSVAEVVSSFTSKTDVKTLEGKDCIYSIVSDGSEYSLLQSKFDGTNKGQVILFGKDLTVNELSFFLQSENSFYIGTYMEGKAKSSKVLHITKYDSNLNYKGTYVADEVTKELSSVMKDNGKIVFYSNDSIARLSLSESDFKDLSKEDSNKEDSNKDDSNKDYSNKDDSNEDNSNKDDSNKDDSNGDDSNEDDSNKQTPDDKNNQNPSDDSSKGDSSNNGFVSLGGKLPQTGAVISSAFIALLGGLSIFKGISLVKGKKKKNEN